MASCYWSPGASNLISSLACCSQRRASSMESAAPNGCAEWLRRKTVALGAAD
jgi:hypothetical protein